MKKISFKRLISIVFAAALCAVFLAACNQTEALRLSPEPPWKYDNSFTENCVYSVERTNEHNVVIARGELSNSLKLDTASNYFVLNTSFSLDYLGDEPRTDTITAMAIFSRTLKPIYAKKTRTINGVIPYEGYYELNSSDSYEFETVYQNFTYEGVSYTQGSKGTFERVSDSEITFGGSPSSADFYCDNEYMFYFVRMVHGLDTGYSNTFFQYDMFKGFVKSSPGLDRTDLAVSVDGSAKDFWIAPALVSENGNGTTFKGTFSEDNNRGIVKALMANIKINKSDSGSDVVAYYSQPIADTPALDTFANNRKVLLGIETVELKISSGATLYKNTYRLSAFSCVTV